MSHYSTTVLSLNTQFLLLLLCCCLGRDPHGVVPPDLDEQRLDSGKTSLERHEQRQDDDIEELRCVACVKSGVTCIVHLMVIKSTASTLISFSLGYLTPVWLLVMPPLSRSMSGDTG